MAAFRHILVPTDFGKYAQRALDVAVEVSQNFDASLTLLHVYEIPTYAYATMNFVPVELLTSVAAAAQQEFDPALVALRTRVPGAKGILRTGVAWEVILAAIEETSADLVVMGTHGHRGIAHILLGSVAEKIVRLSRVPVLTVRASAEART